jgi:hypothetical protein
MKIAGLVVVAALMFTLAPAWAKDPGCCASGKTAKKTMCADYAKLNLSAEQTTQLTALQEKCKKAGCTKESRDQFLQSAQKILSAEQYAALKTECAMMEKKQS